MNDTDGAKRDDDKAAAWDMRVLGAVQGVGFRPFVYRTARAYGLGGWVQNAAHGVSICVAGPESLLQRFQSDLIHNAPSPAQVREVRISMADPSVEAGPFRIMDSERSVEITAVITPDLATCSDCLLELFDPTNPRYRYPFINCTCCGPRYSILERIPYDRPHTTMHRFTMCERCRAEYEDPYDRRFHAQPNACPECGPQLALWGPNGRVFATRHEAVLIAAAAILEGRIIAVKGIGGFHLMADARNNDAVYELRRRKGREEKPFALMFPSLSLIREACQVSELEERLLKGPEAPIVLLRNLKELKCGLAKSVAPDNPLLGVMLPYAPLHHVLMEELAVPLVATSGNLSDEPICIEEKEALARLQGMADYFLVHDRPIARPLDDSIARVMAGQSVVLRRARGYAPRPMDLGQRTARPVLAVGGHLKNTVALAIGSDAFISQHLGDLDTMPAHEAFQDAIQTLRGLYESRPTRYVCDRHPDYASTRYVRRIESDNTDHKVLAVQHHHAHIVSCMIDNEIEGPVLGVAWDGTGLGDDGTIWGGEFMVADRGAYRRVAYVRPFPLPGGERAIREPRRSALGLLYEMYGDIVFEMKDLAPIRAFDEKTHRVLRQMLMRDVQSVRTSAAGRLFDAVAALLDLRQMSSFEGQAAMQLEYAAYTASSDTPAYRIPFEEEADWAPMIQRIINDVRSGRDTASIARAFHNALACLIYDMAKHVGEQRVVLSGGCFQNALLLESTVSMLKNAGFDTYWHRHIPPNDGGLSLGQLGIALNHAS